MLGQLEVDKYTATMSSPFTHREIQIAKMARDGMTHDEIAKVLDVSRRTVEGHLYRVFSKLGIATQGEIPADLELEDEE
jgi:DNA-binding CsgD family transcriptional regulator